MEKIKTVIDTSVIVAGAINPFGSSGKVIDMAIRNRITSYTSSEILDELRFKLTSEKVTKFLESRIYGLWVYKVFKESSILVKPNKHFHFNVSPDLDDNKFFDVVYVAKAKFLITLDKRHMLKLRGKDKSFSLMDHKFLILTPREFLEHLKVSKD
ncbi:putative toxin-antitoxin system toxin component, PIN family [Pyrococcus kukulkanii]|uniref:PIN domain-containing protein n=1 Tax=Pyrococcus kukulkanii TaxID=1609559 RepID=A0A127B9T7_9EURY|nr:putative toxin-antitoxin system toxin component, PIN family [Pyrococcus kukulkanii]AMM53985.1 hypothetical protein TQ32_05450 [Pyrococcus kukulkanii]